ncbi:MAG: hypothetical protein QNI92_09385 [Desulfobacterales bacterium]|nr:hypothetical protein [Desulfobacterales bacterium]MDJ0913677.1 hypothetical protein [Desulfobacterales bacterium]
MLIHDDIYAWEGWGGELQLASGKCRLRLFRVTEDHSDSLTVLRPTVAVLSDVPESGMSVKSCVSHIATSISKDFSLDYHRVLWLEYYPEKTYGTKNEHIIPERIEQVEFTWLDNKAIKPTWRPLKTPMRSIVKALIAGEESK